MNFFRMLFGPRAQYMAVSALPPEDKEKSKKLGIQSLILSIVGTVLLFVFVLIGTMCAQNVIVEPDFPVMSLFGAIVFYVFAFIGLILVLENISFAVFQRKVNKLKIGLASLIVSLICLAISIVANIVILVVML